MDEKQEKINQLLENNKRYYPTDGKGNIDEWGAVIKRQVETFELQRQLQEQAKAAQMQNYGLALDKELQQQEDKKRVRELEKLVDRDNVQRESELRRLIENSQKEQEKQRKLMMGEQIKQTIDQKQKSLQEQRRLEQIKDYETLQNAMRQKEMAEQAEQDKKRMQKEILFADINQSRRMRLQKDDQLRQIDYEADEKAKNNYSYFNGYDQRQNDIQNRMKNFEDQQKRMRDNYNQYVASPQANKLTQEAIRQMRDQQDLESKSLTVQQLEDRQKQLAKQQNLSQLNMQIIQKQEINKLSDKDLLAQQLLQSANVAKMIEEEQMMKRKQQQLAYKDMLDQQTQLRQQMRMHGNMTGVEKQLNKDDLIAWKNYDNNQYSLIPGVSNQKKILDRSQFGYNVKDQTQSASTLNQKSPQRNPDKFQEQQDRMKQYGFTRDVRDVREFNQRAAGAQNNQSLNTSIIVDQNSQIGSGGIRNNATAMLLNRSVEQMEYTAKDLIQDQGGHGTVSQDILYENMNRSPLMPNLKSQLIGNNQTINHMDQQQFSPYYRPPGYNPISNQNANLSSQSQLRSSSNNGGLRPRDRSLINAGNSILL
eukprot:403366567